MNSQLHIYTGAGKGKTTAALGLLLRFLGSGGRACLIQFDKGAAQEGEVYHERSVLKGLPGLTLHAAGAPRFDPRNGTFRFANQPEDFAEARRGLELARTALDQGFGLLVLDEILSLPLTQLAERQDIIALLDAYEAKGRPCELVLTGHLIWPELEERADLVTEMRKRKHYFDRRLQARKGIEY